MSFIWINSKKKVVRKSKASIEVLERLENYLNSNNEKAIEVLCGFWKDQEQAITYQELREALLDDELMEDVLQQWSVDYSVMITAHFKKIWEDAISEGASNEPILQRLIEDDQIKIDTTQPYVLDWIKSRGGQFVTNLADEQKAAIQSLLENKLYNSYSVDELSRMIRPCIGLTKPQLQANIKYYDHIKSTLLKEHPRMSKESVQRKARQASIKYAEKQHRYRAATIAQTEMAFSYNNGADMFIRQAQDDGLIGKVIKKWTTSGDHNVCDICRALNDTEIDLDGEYDFKGKVLFSGQKRLPPAHPRCACAVKYIEVPLNKKDLNAIIKYISPDAYVLNEKLRNGVPLNKMEKEWTDNLDQALDKMPIYKGLLNRSLYFYDESSLQQCLDFYSRDIVIENAYFSATKRGIYNPEAQVQLWINSKNGRNLMMYNADEAEILYPKNFSFKVVRKQLNNGVYNILLEEV